MALILPLWAFALLPLPLLLAALFWGAPPIALVSELIGLVSGKPFPARAARQMSRLALGGHALFWVVVAACLALLSSHPLRQSEFVTGNSLLLIAALALPFFGSLALVGYDLGWKFARERKLIHFLLGCVANIPIKYGYWALAGLGLLYFRGVNLESPAFLPPWGSALWPLMALWLPLSLCLAAAVGLCYLLLRRDADDWGRDYYRFAAPFLAKWHLVCGLIVLAVMVWLYASLKGVFNLHLPQIFNAGLASAACLGLAMLLSLLVTVSENPMRFKVSMVGAAVLSLAHASMLLVAILETLNRYVPGWSVPTFMPDLLRLFR
ncbi:hypothetical protein SAMN05421830_10663 [Desulfomicrobium norvegicum]|uniref:Uncharacterized protein n=1 Tax=Desulfomicrobium norvegicum (strain DSM 1741 / NCIMB 8310) TaxID=52561 RepID=A0A8G2FEH1_DESNO|nr:hypothetical protein [Desulfomicrobium norvegicum]SFL77116.1 hypothetical protein SAMN05421830_10663 [Desulfomicrobium norvegicum]